MRPITFAALAATATLLAAPEARALGPVNVEIAAKAGEGQAGAGFVDGSQERFGTGFGARAGASYLGIYLGANVVDYVGLASVASQQALETGIEAGYGVTYNFFTIRPQLGVGNLRVSVETPSQSGFPALSVSNHFLYLEPALVGLFALGRVAFIGFDGGVLIAPHGTPPSPLSAFVTPGSPSPPPAASTTFTGVFLLGQAGVKL